MKGVRGRLESLSQLDKVLLHLERLNAFYGHIKILKELSDDYPVRGLTHPPKALVTVFESIYSELCSDLENECQDLITGWTPEHVTPSDFGAS